MTRQKRKESKEPQRGAAGAPAAFASANPRRVLGAAILAALAIGGAVFAAVHFFPFFSGPQFTSQPSAAQKEAAQSDPLRAEAFALADQVVKDFPNDLNAIYARGLILNRFGRDPEALECYQVCLKRDPRFAPALYCLGRFAFDQGDHEKCVATMQQAIDAEPEMWDALLYTGRAQMALGKMDQAIEALRRYVQQEPRSTEGHFRLGQAYLHVSRYDEAIASYRAALAVDPRCKYAYFGLAETFRRQGREDLARELLKKFDELDTDRARTVRGQRRDYDDQVAMRESVAHLYTVVAKVYAASGNAAKAQEYIRRAAELSPVRPGEKG